MEKKHEIWYVDCEEPVIFRVTYESSRIISDIKWVYMKLDGKNMTP